MNAPTTCNPTAKSLLAVGLPLMIHMAHTQGASEQASNDGIAECGQSRLVTREARTDLTPLVCPQMACIDWHQGVLAGVHQLYQVLLYQHIARVLCTSWQLSDTLGDLHECE